MKTQLFALSVLVSVLIACTNKEEYRVVVQATNEDAAGTINFSDSISFSDQGIRIKASWKSSKPNQGNAILYDGANNPVWNTNYPTPYDELLADTAHFINYQFTPNDKPGTWRLVMVFDGKELVNHSFKVSPAGADPEAYQSLDCFSAEGKVNLANFYQVSPAESERLRQGAGTWYWMYAIDQLKIRTTVCQAPAFNAHQVDEWEKWFQQLTGKKVRQVNPSVHERISAAMPVYEEEFFFVNPDFVYWFSEHMVPDPQQSQVNGWLYQELYASTIRDAARNMALLYLYYNALPEGGLDAQVQYAETMARKYVNQEEERVMERNEEVDVYHHLTEWHETAANEWVATNIGKEIFGQAPYQYNSTDMGFWLRRGIDGSANELWLALRELLKKYDTAWYGEHIDPHWAP